MDKIKVFVSSAMNAELGGALDWPFIRSCIARSIRAIGLFDVFVIEEHASSDPSNQYMLSQVSDCNVYLLILGYELRYGTKQECQKALELHKDMLVYVFDIEHDNACRALISEIERNDYCCYQKVRVTDDIGDIVANGLMEHLVSRYRGNAGFRPLVAEVQGGASAAHSGVRAIKGFGTSVRSIGERLGYPYGRPVDVVDDAPLCELGAKLVEWLLEGTWTPLGKHRERMTKWLTEAGYNDEELKLVDLRWQACDLYMSGNTNAAIEVLERAAAQGSDRTHVLTGILIDLRNLASERDGILVSRSRQEDINQRGMNQYAPVDYVFMHQVDELLLKAHDADWLTSERTVVLGEYRLSSALLNISNALFANALYGSIAGIENTRLKCGKLLMSFSRLYDDKTLYVSGLRLCALAGCAEDLEKWLDAGFDFANQEIVACANELWDAAGADATGAINGCGCIIFATLGMYLDDGRFYKASRAFFYGAPRVGVGSISETNYSNAITRNAYRMNPGLFVHVVVSVISGQRMHSVYWLNTALDEARLEDASQEDCAELAAALEEQFSWLVKHGFSPACIAVLAKKHKEFAKLEFTIKERLSGFDLIEYELNERGGVLSADYVVSLIEEAKTQLVENDNPGQQSGFGTHPARYLATIITVRSLVAIHKSVETKLAELWNQLAGSGAPGPMLDDYVRLAIGIVVAYKEAGLPLPDDYKVLARALKNKQPPIKSAISIYERKTWVMRVATYRLLVGVGQKRAFLACVSDVWNVGVSTREACAECLESYLRVNRGTAFRDVASIAGVVNVLSRDSDAQVRRKAASCALRLLNTPADADARSILLRLARDPQFGVRLRLLRNDDDMLDNSDAVYELARYLVNDAHFGVRAVAQRTLARLQDMSNG